MIINDNGLDAVDSSENDPPYSYDQWIRLVRSPELSDRCEALDNLSDEASDDIVRDVVIDLLYDPDSLVRTCAADAARLLLGMPEVVDALRLMIPQETDDLAIAFAYTALGRLGDASDIPLFVHGIERLTTPRVKLSVISSFCLLLRRLYLLDAYAFFKADDPKLCTVALNVFNHLIEDENKLEQWVGDEIQILLSKGLVLEETESAHEFIQILNR